MLITSLGEHPEDGRLTLAIGLTPHDIAHILKTPGGMARVEAPDGENPLPVHLILMMGETETALSNTIREAFELAQSGGDDADDDL